MKPQAAVVFVLVILAAVGAAIFFTPPKEAEASFTSDSVKDLTAYLEAGHSINLKLCAISELGQRTDAGVEAAIEKIVKGKDARLAVYAAAQLARRGTETARTRLRALVMTTSLETVVRKSAMTAIAVQWKSSADLGWMEENTASDAALKGHCSFLKSKIYGK